MQLEVNGKVYPVWHMRLVWPNRGAWSIDVDTDTFFTGETPVTFYLGQLCVFSGFVFRARNDGRSVSITVLPGQGGLIRRLVAKQFNSGISSAVKTSIAEAGEEMDSLSVFPRTVVPWYRTPGTLAQVLGRAGQWHCRADGKIVFGPTWPDASAANSAIEDDIQVDKQLTASESIVLLKEGKMLYPTESNKSISLSDFIWMRQR